MTRAGDVTVLHTFQGGPTDGIGGRGALVPAGGGAFHGVTQSGGQWGELGGTIFRMEANGSVRVLQHLYNLDGDYSRVRLWEPIPGLDGNAYVTTPADGKGRTGELFQIAPDGRTTLLRLFPPYRGDFPRQPLLQAPDGKLYGVFLNYVTSPLSLWLFGRVSVHGGVEPLARFDEAGLSSAYYGPPVFLRGRDGHFYGTALRKTGQYEEEVVYRLRVFPDAPTRLVATPRGSHVRITWAPVAGAVSYTLKRGLAPGSATVLATGLTTPAFLDGLVAPGQRYYYLVTALNALGESVASYAVGATAGHATTADFTGDARSDLLVYRPSTHQWLVRDGLGAAATASAIAWGADGDIPVVGDLDGDDRTDAIMFRPATAAWHVLYSSADYRVGWGQVFRFGAPGDVPLAADFDGDGRMDLTTYRPTTGRWSVCTSSSGYQDCRAYVWGLAGDLPLVADFDGDGRTDLTVYRPSTGHWVIGYSSSGYWTWAASVWGTAGDIPLAGDFDGDGRSEITVYRPSTGQWFIVSSTKGWRESQMLSWGAAGDQPVVADFDGDGVSDITVYRPGTGRWFLLLSSLQFVGSTGVDWGAAGDVPLP